MRRLAIAVVAICGFALPAVAHGQVPYRAYSPPGGATLPYQLDYFRPQSGVLDQYNQFVGPKENLANQLGTITQRQNYDYQALDGKVAESDRIRQSSAAATGTSAGFMNYSHYFGKGVTRGSAFATPTTTRRSRWTAPAMPMIGGASPATSYSR